MNDRHAGRVAAANELTFAWSKVPAATLGFWVLKLIATTVGEIGGNLVSMDLASVISKRP